MKNSTLGVRMTLYLIKKYFKIKHCFIIISSEKEINYIIIAHLTKK